MAAAQGVIFDCDGTLLDTMHTWRDVEDELARRAGGVLTKRDTDKLTTLTIPEAGEYLHELFGLGEDGPHVVRMIDELMLEHYRTQAHERPGALAFVQGLAERGVAMSVASSGPQAYLQAGLEHAGFMPYLQAVVSVNDVGASKREPAVYHRARALMGTPLAATWGSRTRRMRCAPCVLPATAPWACTTATSRGRSTTCRPLPTSPCAASTS